MSISAPSALTMATPSATRISQRLSSGILFEPQLVLRIHEKSPRPNGTPERSFAMTARCRGSSLANQTEQQTGVWSCVPGPAVMPPFGPDSVRPPRRLRCEAAFLLVELPYRLGGSAGWRERLDLGAPAIFRLARDFGAPGPSDTCLTKVPPEESFDRGSESPAQFRVTGATIHRNMFS
jgi:hypothetical protein